jgi:hypothetical protein
LLSADGGDGEGGGGRSLDACLNQEVMRQLTSSDAVTTLLSCLHRYAPTAAWREAAGKMEERCEEREERCGGSCKTVLYLLLQVCAWSRRSAAAASGSSKQQAGERQHAQAARHQAVVEDLCQRLDLEVVRRLIQVGAAVARHDKSGGKDAGGGPPHASGDGDTQRAAAARRRGRIAAATKALGLCAELARDDRRARLLWEAAGGGVELLDAVVEILQIQVPPRERERRHEGEGAGAGAEEGAGAEDEEMVVVAGLEFVMTWVNQVGGARGSGRQTEAVTGAV